MYKGISGDSVKTGSDKGRSEGRKVSQGIVIPQVKNYKGLNEGSCQT